MSECPEREHLVQLLADGLTDAEENLLEAHLTLCCRCQTVLEELTPRPLVGLSPLAHDPSASVEDEAAFAALLHALERVCPWNETTNVSPRGS